MASLPQTVGDLRRSEYGVASVKAELRRNLIRKLGSGEPLFPGIRGYDDTVLPQLENAILAGQDIVLLGERGQAKSRLVRALSSLLDEHIPAISGCEINDDPYNPICRRCRDLVADHGDETQITWLGRERRYSEKLATPDTSIADLIGEVDPIRVAEGRYLSDELTIHFGLVPRTNRGIFAEITHLARRSPQVNQRSGVSVRVSIANYENLSSNALRRAIRRGEKEAVPRISDLPSLVASSSGKLELETWEEGDDTAVLEKIIRTATSNVFRRHFTVQEFADVVQRFDRSGFTVEVSDNAASETYTSVVRELGGLERVLGKLEEPSTPATQAAALEFVLEG